MRPNSRRKLLWLAAAVAGCLFLVLLLRPARPEAAPELSIAGKPQMTNGALLISVVLSNGTSRSLNIVDDGLGHPFVGLDAGARSNMPGTIGFGLNALSNTLKLNLASGAALTNTVRLTNPPPRFRLFFEVRDLTLERRRVPGELMRYLVAVMSRRQPPSENSILLPHTPWIQNGTISNSTQNAPARLKETNGLSR